MSSLRHPRRVTRFIGTAAGAAVVAAGAVALAVPAQAAPSTVYVSTFGFDRPGCGNVASQCATIQQGVDEASAGDTVQVAAGTYNEAVFIGKSVTLQGAAGAIIDGQGEEQTRQGSGGLAYGVVYVGNADNVGTSSIGDVTVSGFTIKNPIEFAGSDGAPETVALRDTNPADHITIKDNTIEGNTALAPGDGQIGINSFANAATTTISGNDISGVYQGIFLEDNGPAAVEGNTIHDLYNAVDGPTIYNSAGVFIVSDTNETLTGQNVVGNTFRDYAGYGVAFSAAYDQGNCVNNVCAGAITNSKITNNTFALGGVAGAAAIRLKALSNGSMDVNVANNTGTVTSPTRTITELNADGGVLDVSTTGAPNTIIPSDGTVGTEPTISYSAAAKAVAGGPAVDLSGTATNKSGQTLPHAGFEFAITGASGLQASDLTLKYQTGQDGANFDGTVPLAGTTANGGSITGFFGPQSGFPFPSGPGPRQTPFKLTVAAGAPGGTVSTKVSLVEVSIGTGNPVLNTLASDSAGTAISEATSTSLSISPSPAVQNKPITATVSVSPASATGTVQLYLVGSGQRATGTLVNGTATLSYTPKSAGTFPYEARYLGDAAHEPSTSTQVSLKIKANVTPSLVLSPNPATHNKTLKAKITVKKVGSAAATGKVTLYLSAGASRGTRATGTLVNGTATLSYIPRGTGKITYEAKYVGDANYVAATSAAKKITIK